VTDENGAPKISGTLHDFTVQVRHHIYSVWHSDKGEWTVQGADQHLHRAPSRDAAIALCEQFGSVPEPDGLAVTA